MSNTPRPNQLQAGLCSKNLCCTSTPCDVITHLFGAVWSVRLNINLLVWFLLRLKRMINHKHDELLQKQYVHKITVAAYNLRIKLHAINSNLIKTFDDNFYRLVKSKVVHYLCTPQLLIKTKILRLEQLPSLYTAGFHVPIAISNSMDGSITIRFYWITARKR